MATPGISCGICPEDLHKLRYQCVVNREGKRILIQVFEWSYKGGTLSVKEQLFLDPDFSNARYKSTFNAQQRKKLDDGQPVSSFDITLLYQVLRRVCDLSLDDSCWINEDPSGSSLENLIYKVKLHRNKLSHEDFHITQTEMKDKLEELRHMFLDIIKKAGHRFSRTDGEVAGILQDINQRIDQVYKKIREPLGTADVEQYKKEIKEMREQLESNIKEAAKKELDDFYTRLCEINLLPWILSDFRVNPTQIFTKFRLKEEAGVVGDRKPQSISHDGILEALRPDGNRADVLIISGEGGMGKTTFLKYLTEMWVKDPSSIPGLDQAELLFYIECRNSTLESFDQLIQSLLHQTHRKVNVEFEHVRETVLHMQILILVDGFDEVNSASKQVIREALRLSANNVRILFTTRPGSLSVLCSLLPDHRRQLILLLEGITKELHSEFVGRLFDSFLFEEERKADIKLSMDRQLKRLDECLGTHLNSPLNLTLFTMLFIQNPSTMDSLKTATDLYILLTKLITEKLTERIIMKISAPDVEYKITQFAEFNDNLSFRTMQRQEYELAPDTVQSVRSKCLELGLPFEEIMAAFFTVRRSRSLGLFSNLIYSYHHLRLQEFSAARHLHRNLTHSIDLEHVVNTYLAEAEEYISQERFQNVLVHLSGLLASDSDLLASYSHKLLSMVTIRSTCVDPILAHVVESKVHPDMVKAAASQVDDHVVKWDGWIQVKHSTSLSVLSTVLDAMSSTFKVMALVVFSRSSTDSHLLSAFRSLSQKEAVLVLDLYNFYFGDIDCTLSEEPLQLLLQKGGRCLLEGFRGSLSETALPLLPSCLKELRLRVTFEQANILSTLIPHLENLQILGLKYDDPEKRDPEELHPPPFKGRKFSLTLTTALRSCEQDVEWATSVLSRFSSLRPERNCTNVFFSGTDLDRDGIEKMLKLLHRKGVTVSQRLDLQLMRRLMEPDLKYVSNVAQSLNLGSLIIHMAGAL